MRVTMECASETGASRDYAPDKNLMHDRPPTSRAMLALMGVVLFAVAIAIAALLAAGWAVVKTALESLRRDRRR